MYTCIRIHRPPPLYTSCIPGKDVFICEAGVYQVYSLYTCILGCIPKLLIHHLRFSAPHGHGLVVAAKEAQDMFEFLAQHKLDAYYAAFLKIKAVGLARAELQTIDEHSGTPT